MLEKKFFVIKRNDVRVEIIRFLKNFNTTKVALFRGCVPKIISFIYKLAKWQSADEIVQKTA